jgi:hypothetical protein
VRTWRGCSDRHRRERTTCRPSPPNDGTVIFSAAAGAIQGRGLGLCGILFQIGELQFELIEWRRAVFR